MQASATGFVRRPAAVEGRSLVTAPLVGGQSLQTAGSAVVLKAGIVPSALVAAWAVEKCKFILQGLKQFFLAVDHNPLIAIFDMHNVEQITNARLRSHRLKLTNYRFKYMNIDGFKNKVADCLSRQANPEMEARDQARKAQPKPESMVRHLRNQAGYPV